MKFTCSNAFRKLSFRLNVWTSFTETIFKSTLILHDRIGEVARGVPTVKNFPSGWDL